MELQPGPPPASLPSIFTTDTAQSFVFSVNPHTEVMSIHKDGRFFVRGEEVETTEEIRDIFLAWVKSCLKQTAVPEDTALVKHQAVLAEVVDAAEAVYAQAADSMFSGVNRRDLDRLYEVAQNGNRLLAGQRTR